MSSVYFLVKDTPAKPLVYRIIPWTLCLVALALDVLMLAMMPGGTDSSRCLPHKAGFAIAGWTAGVAFVWMLWFVWKEQRSRRVGTIGLEICLLAACLAVLGNAMP